jgi:tRNA (guanine37-N1)-methyltransferase
VHDVLGAVPEVLLSGDHAAIARWRRQQALGRTWLRRPDLLARCVLDDESRVLLEAFRREHVRHEQARQNEAAETGRSD